MIESKKLVPRSFSRSRHYRALLKLTDIALNSAKSDIENLVAVINPDKCPNMYLPLLAAKVGYSYDFNLSYSLNRKIIKYFPYMLKLRGSESGIKIATALSISTYSFSDIPTLSSLVNIVYETINSHTVAVIYIYFPTYSEKIHDLLKLVMPIGVGYKLVSTSNIGGTEDLLVEAPSVTVDSDVFTESSRYLVSTSNEVGHGEVINKVSAYFKTADSKFYMSHDNGTFSDIISEPDINGIYLDLLTNVFYKYNGTTFDVIS